MPGGLEAAPRAVKHCVERASQLYEQVAKLVRIEAYVTCWQRWARSGLLGWRVGVWQRHFDSHLGNFSSTTGTDRRRSATS